MESEQEKGKLFVANLKREVTADHLITYFSSYGEVTDALVVRHKGTSDSKGFGFVTFDDPAVAATVLDEANHMILDQKIDVKKAKPKNPQRVVDRENGNNRNYSNDDGNNNNGDAENKDNFMLSDGNNARFSRKIFVGGLPPNITKEELGDFFATFGAISDVFVILHRETKKPRGFGFVTFESEETAAEVLKNKFYKLNDRNVEVKRADPKIKKLDNEIHVYNSYSNLELSRNPYGYCDFYWPMWSPYCQPCSFCASRGVLDPSCYFCASQYSIYNAQSSLNNLVYDGGEEHKNDYETAESSIGNSSRRLMEQKIKEHHQEGQTNVID